VTNKLMTQNLTMVEHAAKDPRSASAMLRGNGDGREQPWLDFEKNNPEITDQELLMAQFSHEARYGRVKSVGSSTRVLRLMMGLVGVLIIVF
jgi:hypothetical protein